MDRGDPARPPAGQPPDEALRDERDAILDTALRISNISLPIALDINGSLGSEKLNFAPILEVDPQSLDPDRARLLDEWFELKARSFDGEPGDITASWIVISGGGGSPVAVLGVLVSYTPRPDEYVSFPFHLVLDLGDRTQNAAAQRVADAGELQITRHLDKENMTALVVEDQIYGMDASAISLDVTADLYAALRKSGNFATLLDTYGESAFWGFLVRQEPGGTVELLAPGPWRTDELLNEATREIVLGQAPGARLVLRYNPLLFTPESGRLLPPGRDPFHLTIPDADQSLTVANIQEAVEIFEPTRFFGKTVRGTTRTATRPRAGWAHRSLMLVIPTGDEPDTYMLIWELGLCWRQRSEIAEHEQAEDAIRALLTARRATAWPMGFLELIIFLASTAHLDIADAFIWLETWPEISPDLNAALLATWDVVSHVLVAGESEEHEETTDIIDWFTAMLGAEAVAEHMRAGRLDEAFLPLMFDAARACWAPAPAARLLTVALRRVAEPGVAMQRAVSLAVVGLWKEIPPPAGGEQLRLTLVAASAWAQHLVLHDPSTVLLPEDAALLKADPLKVWIPWQAMDTDAWPAEFDQLRAWKVERLCAEHARRAAIGAYPVAGFFDVLLPDAVFQRLDAIGVREIRVAATERVVLGRRTPSVWLRIGTDELGMVLPFVAGETVPASWEMLLPPGLRYELFLAMSAWYADMRDQGERRVMEPRALPGEPASEPRRQRGRAPGGQPSVLRVPRRVVVRPPASGPTSPPRKGAYGVGEDLLEIHRRVSGISPVRAHPFVPLKRQKFTASEEKREAWAMLDLATRIEIAGQVDFPEVGTIRGLRLHVEDSGERWVEVGYQRGYKDPEQAPRPVVAAALREAWSLLRAIEPER